MDDNAKYDNLHFNSFQYIIDTVYDWKILKFCGGGSIKNVMEITKLPLKEYQICVIMPEILKGLEYIHKYKLIRRSIKSQLIHLDHKGQCKISDFGLSSIYSNCDIIQSFICNLPSTLCNKNQWNIINGDWRFDDKYCDIYNYDNGHDRDDVLLMDITSNNWKYIVIDYLFKLFEIKTNGYGGIVIHIDEIFKDKETRRLRGLFVNTPDYNNNNNIELFISFSGSILTSILMISMHLKLN